MASVIEKVASLAKRSDDDTELRGDVVKTLLRIAAMGAMGGAAGRIGMEALRNSDPRYKPPTTIKPVVVDVPYEAPAPLGGIPKTDVRKEKQIVKYADGVVDWIKQFFPTYHPITGGPDARTAADVPLTAMLTPAAFIGGGLGAYELSDRLMRSADRHDARSELDDAKREYQNLMIKRLASSRLPAKVAVAVSKEDADAPLTATSVAMAKRLRGAIDGLFDEVDNEAKTGIGMKGTKLAQAPAVAAIEPGPSSKPTGTTPDPSVSQGWKTVMSWLFPGLALEDSLPGAAAANMMVSGGLGLLGGYGGYQHFRDAAGSQVVRAQMNKLDRENAQKQKAPVVARLVPVSRPS